jgi:universal stress protein F
MDPEADLAKLSEVVELGVRSVRIECTAADCAARRAVGVTPPARCSGTFNASWPMVQDGPKRRMQRILVALDGSPRAPGVLATAVAMARAGGAKVTLLRSVGGPPNVPEDFWKTSDGPLPALMRRQAQRYLDECAAAVASDLLVDSLVVIGVPWQIICATAQRSHADFVVIGSHGHAGPDRLLGTTAAKVVNHAPCTVVIVRERSHRPD